MDKTRFISAAGDGNESSLPVAYQRAPTLLTSASGLRGEVRVWSSDLKLIRRDIYVRLLVDMLFFAIIFGSYWKVHLATGQPINPLILILASGLPGTIVGLAPLVRARMRPRYLSTDLSGIGITTARGATSLRWDEIAAVDSNGATYITLRLASGKKVSMNLLGFPWKDQDALRALIAERAQLLPDPHSKYRFVREALPEQKAIPASLK